MALYASSKHALEGYSESVDHEVREHGVRVLLVEPGFTKTSFDANLAAADTPLPLYAQQRKIVDAGLADALKAGDEPSIVGHAIVAAATDERPKLRYPAGKTAAPREQGAPLRAHRRLRQADPQAQPAQPSRKHHRLLARAGRHQTGNRCRSKRRRRGLTASRPVGRDCDCEQDIRACAHRDRRCRRERALRTAGWARIPACR